MLSSCSTVRANARSEGAGSVRRHYAGFQRGRLSEQLRSTEKSAFSLQECVDWTKELGERVRAVHRVLPEFFGRYLSPTVPPSPISPKYLVLNVFGGDFDLEDVDGNAIEFADSIVEVTERENAQKAELRWDCLLRYRDLAVLIDNQRKRPRR